MKLIVVLTLLGAAVVARAEDLKTRGGKEYKDIKVMAVEADGLKIMHAAGMAKIPYEQLPDDLQTKYAFDPAKAAEKRVDDAKKRKIAAIEAEAEAMKKDLYKKAEATTIKVSGRVMQVLKDRVLLSGAQGVDERLNQGGDIAGGIVCVLCSTEKLTDGIYINQKMYPVGRYRYTDISGATRLVPAYVTHIEDLTRGLDLFGASKIK